MTENSWTASSGISWPTEVSNWLLLSPPSSRMLVLADRAAVDAESGAAADLLAAHERDFIGADVVDVARERHQVVGVARQRRQLDELLRGDRGLELRRPHVDGLGRRNHVDLLAEVADLEPRIGRGVATDRNHEAGLHVLEAGQLETDVVG